MCAKRRSYSKDMIIEQARILFWQKGYCRTSVRAIAKACGFEPSNIYNYFPSKEEVLYEVLREEVDRLIGSVKHLESNTGSNPTERLRTLIHNSLNVLIGTRLGPRLPFDMEIRHLFLTLPVHENLRVGTHFGVRVRGTKREEEDIKEVTGLLGLGWKEDIVALI